MFASVKYAAASAARKAALLTAGLLLLGIGLGFLTAAMWIVLSLAYGTLTAAAVLGARERAVPLHERAAHARRAT